MTYAELYNKVAASLESRQTFSITVETWHRNGRAETEWDIYIPFGEGRTLSVTGNTADEAFNKFEAEVSDTESLEQTSDAVGTAEVDA
jgi:hypothetical protein